MPHDLAPRVRRPERARTVKGGQPPRAPTGDTPGARYHHWYGTPVWVRLRAAHLRREPWCRMCARLGRQTLANTVDHVVAHRGDRRLFLDPSNLQSLCQIHHGEKQKIEMGYAPTLAIGADGWPLPPDGAG